MKDRGMGLRVPRERRESHSKYSKGAARPPGHGSRLAALDTDAIHPSMTLIQAKRSNDAPIVRSLLSAEPQA
jgi:hypothetical protein